MQRVMKTMSKVSKIVQSIEAENVLGQHDSAISPRLSRQPFKTRDHIRNEEIPPKAESSLAQSCQRIFPEQRSLDL